MHRRSGLKRLPKAAAALSLLAIGLFGGIAANPEPADACVKVYVYYNGSNAYSYCGAYFKYKKNGVWRYHPMQDHNHTSVNFVGQVPYFR